MLRGRNEPLPQVRHETLLLTLSLTLTLTTAAGLARDAARLGAPHVAQRGGRLLLRAYLGLPWLVG